MGFRVLLECRGGKVLEEVFVNFVKFVLMDLYEFDLDVCCVKLFKFLFENMRLDVEVWLLLLLGLNKMLVGEEGVLGLLLYKFLFVGFNIGELVVDFDIVI